MPYPLPADRLRRIARFLDAAWKHRAARSAADFVELLDDWIEEHEISDENVVGWYDYCSSIVYVAYHFMESYQEEPAYFSASHSYQAIYEREIIATLTRSIVEPEARLLEQANLACMAEIEFQLALLDRVESGEDIARIETY